MLNLLLLFVPITLGLVYFDASPTFIFVAAALSIVPLAGWLSRATEELATKLGAGIGGLLNATFGNATELIIAFLALRAGQVDVVKASITGSIIGNILLVLGFAAFLGGRRYPQQTFNVQNVRVLSSMLVIAMIGYVVPAVFDFNERTRFSQSDAQSMATDARLSLGVAIVLLVLYVGNLVFSLITHRDYLSNSDEPDSAQATWTPMVATGILVVATIFIALMSEALVDALEGFTTAISLSPTFVGLIIIPIVGNAAEHASAVTFALKNKMDLSVSIALGSALQIALLVSPLLIVLSWVIGQPTDLVLRGPLELIALIGAVFIGTSVARDGETNWYEGLMLLGVYVILALAFYWTPIS